MDGPTGDGEPGFIGWNADGGGDVAGWVVAAPGRAGHTSGMRYLLCGWIVLAAVMAGGCEKPRTTAYQRHQMRDAGHDRAVSVIEAAGGSVLPEDPGSNVIVDLRGLDERRARAVLAAVNQVFQVSTLTVIGPMPRDLSLAAVQPRRSLAVVLLEDVRLTAADWNALASWPELASLTLLNTGLGDAQVDSLLRLRGLKRLTLVNQPVTDAGISRLAQLSSLRRLRLVQAGGSMEVARQLVDVNPYLVVDIGGEKVRGVDATE